MGSKSRRAGVAFCGVALAMGCSGAPARYPLRERAKTDTDMAPVYARCHDEPDPKDPKHVSCAPEVYVSPLAWDGIDNSIFRPLSDALAVRASHEAANADAFDEVEDSAWFTNRIGLEDWAADELALGACKPAQLLEGAENVADGAWVIDKGKDNGSSPGFRIKVPGKGKYLLKSDAPQVERPSASAVIGAAAYYAAGFNFSCEQVVYVKRAAFTLTPGLTVTDNSERTRPFDQAALDKVLDGTTKKGDLLRFQASAWLSGKIIGPLRYEGRRDDDPNDVIDHEDRRELRGARLLAAWLDHFDSREQNTLDVWVASDSTRPDSSPGYVRHYMLDTSDALGSEWDWNAISRRLGHSYLLDWGDIGLDFVTLGLLSRPWDRAERAPGHEIFGYYSTRDFVPDRWLNEYPNPAFSRMTERDGAWMARILARFTPELVSTLARMGQFSDPSNTTYLASVMEARLEAILARYLTRLSPLARVEVQGSALCADDLAELRGLRRPEDFGYRARIGRAWLPVTRPAPGRVCVALPQRSHADSSDGQGAYMQIIVEDGVATGPLVAYVYDLGSRFELAALERPESVSDVR